MFEKIARWIKKRYTRIESLTYASPRALKFREEGGVFRRMGGRLVIQIWFSTHSPSSKPL